MLTKIQSALATDISSETTKLADAIVGLGVAFPSISSFLYHPLIPPLYHHNIENTVP